MGSVYAVVNQKGGVGKTTTAVNVCSYMALAGARVLLVDADPQANATSGLGIDRQAAQYTTYSVIIDNVPVSKAVMPTPVAGLLILPATSDLAGADIELMPRISRETFLRQALAPARQEFDVIVIDAPPSLGLLTLNSLVAADAVLIPIQTEYYALEGMSKLMHTIDLVKAQLNPTLDIARVILTMFDYRTRLSKQVVDEVKAYFKDKVTQALVPRNVRLSEAPSHGLPIALYDPKSQGAAAYQSIAQEVLQDAETRSR